MTQFEDKLATVLINVGTLSQQIILNGQLVKQEIATCSGTCSHCNTVLINGQPGATIKDFMDYLESLRQADSLGYCPSCGYRLSLYETLNMSDLTPKPEEEVKADE